MTDIHDLQGARARRAKIEKRVSFHGSRYVNKLIQQNAASF
jgi:hypothetical protein